MTSALGTGTHDNSKDSAHSVHGPGCAIWASQPPSLGLCWERKSCLDRYSVNETGLPALLRSSRGRSLPMPLMPHPALPATQRGRDWTGGVGRQPAPFLADCSHTQQPGMRSGLPSLSYHRREFFQGHQTLVTRMALFYHQHLLKLSS